MLNVNGYIKNNAGQPVPFASLGIYDGDLNYTGEGTAANAGGYFTFYVNEENEPYMLQASSAGYKSLGVKLSTFTNGSVITLQPNIITNQGVTVYSNQKNKLPLWLALFPLLAIVADKRKGSKVSGIKNIYTGLPPWARGAVIVGGGFISYKFLNNILRKKSGTQTVNDANQDLQQQQQQGISPTYPDTQYNAWSEQITKQFAGCDPTYYFPDGFSYSGRLVNNIFKQLNNNVDFLKLVTIYNVRKYDQCGVWPLASDFEGSLFAAIVDELTEGERTRLTATLKSRGITYKV